MSDPTASHDAEEDTGVGSDRGSTTGVPRWVKVSLVVVGVLIALFLVLKLTGLGGEHGPGRHMGPAGDTGRSSGVEHRPPPGVDHGR